jgi:CheY-like chemotaxis protein
VHRRVLVASVWAASLGIALLLGIEWAGRGRARAYVREVELPPVVVEKRVFLPRPEEVPAPAGQPEKPHEAAEPAPGPSRPERLRQPGLSGLEICRLLREAEESELAAVDVAALLETAVSEGHYEVFDPLRRCAGRIRDFTPLDEAFLRCMRSGGYGPRGVENYLNATGRTGWRDCAPFLAAGLALPPDRASNFAHGFDYLPKPPDAEEFLRWAGLQPGVDPAVVADLRSILEKRP